MSSESMPLVPYPFIVEPETYYMAVRYYLNTVTERALKRKAAEKVTALEIIGVMREDADALDAARKRGRAGMRYRPRNTPALEARQWAPDTDPGDLAAWCGGWFYTGSQHGHTTPPWQYHTCLNLTVAGDSKGHADPGDWIVLAGDGIYRVLSAEEFEDQFEAVMEEEGCSCCQAYSYPDRPPGAECPRCGHLNRSHG